MRKQYPQIVVEAWSIYEALRRLGFADEQIRTAVGPAINPVTNEFSNKMVYVQLRTMGQTFVYAVAPADLPFETVRDELERLRTDISKRVVSDKELRKLWKSTEMGSDEAKFLTMGALLLSKGIRVPVMEN